MEEYCCKGQATLDNTAHAHFMLDTKGYKHTLKIRNAYCFFTATMAARKHLNITLYVLCLFCFNMLPLILDFYSLYLNKALENFN